MSPHTSSVYVRPIQVLYLLHVVTVPGHKDFKPNKRADIEAKKGAEGQLSPAKDLPSCLRKQLPASVLALRQENAAKMKWWWTKNWRALPRCRKFTATDASAPSTEYLKLIEGLSRKQLSIITQFRTNRLPLNYLLSRINQSGTPLCPYCGGITVETIRHYILDCPHHRHAQHTLESKLGRKPANIAHILSDKSAMKEFLRFIHAMKHFKT